MASNTPRPTKAERRAAARAQAQAQREEQARKERRAKIARRSILGLGAAALVGVGGTLYYQARTKGTGGSSKLSSKKANKTGVPQVVLADGALTVGQNLTLGGINSGGALLEVYYDYSCIHCAEFEELHGSELDTLAGDGTATVALRPTRALGQPWTDMVMNAMGLIIDKEPDKALAFHKAAFKKFYNLMVQSQGNWSILTVDAVSAVAKDVGVSTELIGSFQGAVDANTYGPWTALGDAAAKKAAIRGTPAVFLDGEMVDLASLGSKDALTKLIEDKS